MGIRKVFYEHLTQTPALYPRLFAVLNSTRASEQDLTGVGLEDWKLTQETKASQYTDSMQGYTKNFVHNEWTSGFKVSKKMVDDDWAHKLLVVIKSLVIRGTSKAKMLREPLASKLLFITSE